MLTELQGQAHGVLINELSQLVQNFGDQQHVAVLDGADIDQDEAGAAARWRGWNERQAAAGQSSLKLKQDLLLQCFGEVELGRIPGLTHLQKCAERLEDTAYYSSANPQDTPLAPAPPSPSII